MYEVLVKWCTGLGWDKCAHALAFFVMTHFLLRWLSPEIVVPICASIGIAKEVFDKYRGGDISLKDMLADAVGIALGFI